MKKIILAFLLSLMAIPMLACASISYLHSETVQEEYKEARTFTLDMSQVIMLNMEGTRLTVHTQGPPIVFLMKSRPEIIALYTMLRAKKTECSARLHAATEPKR